MNRFASVHPALGLHTSLWRSPLSGATPVMKSQTLLCRTTSLKTTYTVRGYQKFTLKINGLRYDENDLKTGSFVRIRIVLGGWNDRAR
ncbi:hypothetical protein [Paraburkholderia sediminicola]|uniref:hypothetical protein n=1 Tax=Paraburkholderia sediminicola TaxID=458836 RepID=UPI0038B74138